MIIILLVICGVSALLGVPFWTALLIIFIAIFILGTIEGIRSQ